MSFKAGRASTKCDDPSELRSATLRKKNLSSIQGVDNMENMDLDFLAQTKVPELTQRDILKMYVGNWTQLNLKQRGNVMGFV